jgi:glutathione peroxidase-family protein
MAYSSQFAAAELVTRRDVPLSEFEGKVALIVNVASC